MAPLKVLWLHSFQTDHHHANTTRESKPFRELLASSFCLKATSLQCGLEATDSNAGDGEPKSDAISLWWSSIQVASDGLILQPGNKAADKCRRLSTGAEGADHLPNICPVMQAKRKTCY
jgi:hypothetical protein